MGVYIPDSNNIDGWISSKFATLAEILHDYDPYLELRWIPPDKRTREDKKPYVVIDTRSSTPVVYASELDVPEHLLAHVINVDNKTGSVLSKLESYEAAYKLFQQKEFLIRMEEAADEAQALKQSPLNRYRFKGKVLDDQRREIGTVKEKKNL